MPLIEQAAAVTEIARRTPHRHHDSAGRTATARITPLRLASASVECVHAEDDVAEGWVNHRRIMRPRPGPAMGKRQCGQFGQERLAGSSRAVARVSCMATMIFGRERAVFGSQSISRVRRKIAMEFERAVVHAFGAKKSNFAPNGGGIAAVHNRTSLMAQCSARISSDGMFSAVLPSVFCKLSSLTAS